MSDSLNRSAESENDQRRYALRMIVAGIIKDILSARLQVDSENVSSETREQWWGSSSAPATKSPHYLLRSAARHLETFQQHHFGRGFSVSPFDSEDPSDPDFQEQRVCELILDFAEPSALLTAAASVRTNQTVDWSALADWDSLPELRRLLDRLAVSSHPDVKNAVAAPKIMIEPPGRIFVAGNWYEGLTHQQMQILDCLLSRPRHSAGVELLKDKLWGVNHSASGEAVRSALSRINGFFKAQSIPLEARSKNGYVFLEDLQE